MKPIVLLLLVLALGGCGKDNAGNKDHGSATALGDADAMLVYYAMPG